MLKAILNLYNLYVISKSSQSDGKNSSSILQYLSSALISDVIDNEV